MCQFSLPIFLFSMLWIMLFSCLIISFEIEDFVAGKVPATSETQTAPPPATPSLDPKLQKYAKMLKMHIPKHAVINKMRQDGVEEERFQDVRSCYLSVSK